MKVRIMSREGTRVIDLNRRTAIRERCLNCTGWSSKAVEECDNDKWQQPCPLHPFRLGKGKQDAKDRARATRDYCLWCMNGQTLEISKCTTLTCPLFPFRKARLDKSVDLDSMTKKYHIAVSGEANDERSVPIGCL
jgi:hypothetical protein